MAGGRLGAFAANVLSGGARVLGVLIYYLLRAIYRPRDRAIALGGLAVLVGFIVLLVYLL